ncbi:hypothetical protein EKO04_007871 [Ascochyta lentis]|uniref:N-acetyltransferase domain-containing protein n=1 Tax=Ascochyta lentis TaxID=205686 RepID=A0A8H7J2J2_9PLEO|nr:hypothetical protein EKO04_007871 [Ascochyta lentis]
MATNNISTNYKFIRVPRTSSRLREIVAKFRTERLSALETDPASFVSQHATESALPLEVWNNRLSRETTVLICVASNNDSTPLDDETALIHGEWAGFAALRGPLSYEDYYFSADMNLPVPANPQAEARWYIYDLYTLPAHRGRGLAKRLVNTSIQLAVAGTQTLRTLSSDNVSLQSARIRLFMNPKNTWLVQMYEGFGFRGVGRVTKTEGLRAGALDDSLPEDTESSEELRRFWHSRNGLAMEQVVMVG